MHSLRIKLLGTLLLSFMAMRCAQPQPSPSNQPDAASSASPATTASPSAKPPLDQNAVTLWFKQRGLETRGLVVMSQSADGGSAAGQPMRIQFSTPTPQGELEKWRLQLRTDLSAWLVQQGHTEGQCTSVDVKPAKDLIAVDIQIVCR